jgi:hypothetical protein
MSNKQVDNFEDRKEQDLTSHNSGLQHRDSQLHFEDEMNDAPLEPLLG